MSFTNYRLKLENIAAFIDSYPPQKQIQMAHAYAREMYEHHEEDFKRMSIQLLTEDIQEACVQYRRDKNEVLRRL